MGKRSLMWRFGVVMAPVLVLAACGEELGQAQEDAAPENRQAQDFYDPNDSLFGEGGISLNSVRSGELFGIEPGEGSLPVNKFLWQASLDTLSFLPLASTDPFTGVIATDWGASPSDSRERFKVTAYMVRPALAASSLKVAVYRERLTEQGVWVPAPVDPATPRKLEDAILVRARQIKIAELEGGSTG